MADATTGALLFTGMRRCLVLVLALYAAQPAHAQPSEPPVDDEPISEDTELGAVVTIEAITIRGNSTTQTDVIEHALPIAEGDVLKQSDSRLRDARFKLLALGYFRDVVIAMHKGSARGRVVVDIKVVERGTLVLNKLWFGSSDFSHHWLGADVGDRNLLGLGIAAGFGVISAGSGDVDHLGTIPGPQWAGEMRLAADHLHGTRWGVMGSLTLVRGSDYHLVEFGDDVPQQEVFAYRRFGGRAGVTYDVTPLTRVSAQARVESITHDLTGGEADAWLLPGESRVVTTGISFDRDTRPEPILPHRGYRVSLGLDVGTSPAGSDYEFATAFAHLEQWWPLASGRSTIGIRVDAGQVFGDAPRFDRIYLSDFNRTLTPRALGLVLSTARPIDILQTNPAKPAIGVFGALAGLEFAHELSRGPGRRHTYGSDLFVGIDVFGITEDADDAVLGGSTKRDLNLDLYANVGVRIDTDLGVFELSLANAVGRFR